MQKLYVLYDPRCGMCERLRDWLLVQRSWIGLSLIAAGSEKARSLFPGLEKIATSEDLVVISDEGEVYLNNHAWIMVLYALEDYREWARRLTHPLLLPMVRQAWAMISSNRHGISRWLALGSPEKLAGELRNVPLEPCVVPEGTVSEYLR
jgi:predicted DCC family thiol-disulfide oxidoreductase YuxK